MRSGQLDFGDARTRAAAALANHLKGRLHSLTASPQLEEDDVADVLQLAARVAELAVAVAAHAHREARAARAQLAAARPASSRDRSAELARFAEMSLAASTPTRLDPPFRRP